MNHKANKTLIILLLAVCAVFISSTPALAAGDQETVYGYTPGNSGGISVLAANPCSGSNSMTRSGGTVSVRATTYAIQKNTCNVSGYIQRLQGSTWTNYKAITSKSANNALSVTTSGSYTIEKGYQYRLRTYHSVPGYGDYAVSGIIDYR